MLTNLTNLTRSATQTLLTNGARSLALVVDVNMARADLRHSRQRFHLHVGPRSPAGMPPKPILSECIRINRIEPIPGSPLGIGWIVSDQSQSPSSWSRCSSLDVRRNVRRNAVSGRRVVRPGQSAGCPAAYPVNAAATAFTTTRAHDPLKTPDAEKRPALMGG